MEEYIDVNKELEQKNQEMFLNKKRIDLDNSMESLMVFYSNYSMNVASEINNRICIYRNINSSSEDSKILYNTITSFFLIVSKKLKEIINNQIEPIKDKLDGLTDEEYIKKLNDISTGIIDNMSSYFKENANMLSDELNQDIDDDIKNSINKYILDILTIKMINMLRDKIMYSIKVINNNYEANKEIIENINEKTLK